MWLLQQCCLSSTPSWWAVSVVREETDTGAEGCPLSLSLSLEACGNTSQGVPEWERDLSKVRDFGEGERGCLSLSM